MGMDLPLVGTIYSQSYKFVTGVKIKTTDDAKLNDSPGPDTMTMSKVRFSPTQYSVHTWILYGFWVYMYVRAVASMRQTEALASVIFSFSQSFFSFNTLNTWEENLTMDIASVIILTMDTATVEIFFLLRPCMSLQ